MSPPHAILFDLDGMLVDTVPFILASVRHAFEGYGSAPTDAEWIAGIGTPLRAQLGEFVRRPEDVEPLLQRYRTFWIDNHDRMTRPFPGARETVLALREAGHPIGIVTAKTEEGARRTLRHVGLLDAVDAMVGADTCPRSKPDPMPVQVALERLGRAPSEAVFVGDSPHDVAAGNAAGALTVAALWGACDRECLARAGPAHYLDEIAALPGLLAGLGRAGAATGR
ncbi:MAG TPA: HAD-IA family hydrolase [Anaeromyxobacteraceae bacterium]|nr:HAD-IA family hydrolase [Anaeromyxobacteraceae bacterium]